jgi:hypothetical protein
VLIHDARVVDQDIDNAVVGRDACDKGGDGGVRGDVELEEGERALGLAGLELREGRGALGGGAGGEDDVVGGGGVGEGVGCVVADA